MLKWFLTGYDTAKVPVCVWPEVLDIAIHFLLNMYEEEI